MVEAGEMARSGSGKGSGLFATVGLTMATSSVGMGGVTAPFLALPN